MTSGIIAVVLGYLLGSIPSAYIVGRLVKGIDIREAGDGHIGAGAVFRRLGAVEGMIAGVVDFSKGAAAVILTQALGASLMLVLLAGIAAVAGHNWSIFLQFQGGLGASTSYGALAWLMSGQLLIGLGIAGIVYLATRRAGLSTGVMFVAVSTVLLIQTASPMLVAFPIFLAIPMFLKRALVEKTGVGRPDFHENYPLKG